MAKKSTRRATKEQVRAMADSMASAGKDAGRTRSLKAGCEDNAAVYGGDMPDEERESEKKVDFSVLTHSLMDVRVLEEASLRELPADQLIQYALMVNATLLFYVSEYKCVACELANAAELVLNGRNALFGRSSERSSALFGKNRDDEEKECTGEAAEDERSGQAMNVQPAPEETGASDQADAAGQAGTDTGQGSGGKGPDGRDRSGKGTPRRKKGCADHACRSADTRHVDITIPEDQLDALFGKGNWRELKSLETTVKEYKVIPAKIVVVVYHLHKYGAKIGGLDGHGDIATSPNPVKRARAGSRFSNSLLAHVFFYRNILRLPVNRICDHMRMIGLDIHPQNIYENLQHYDLFFTPLLERMWTLLLTSHYIQADETPVLYYDRKEGKVKRGYLWVFTTGEMLDTPHRVTLFHFAEGRGACVLREVLRGFTGVLGSDGHAAYQLFARESGGKVLNAGCLDHFRKRVVRALRAVPGLSRMTEDEKRMIPAYRIMEKLNAVFRLERKVKELKTKKEREKLREDDVRAAFDELVKVTLQTGKEEQRAGSYTSDIIHYMQNQEVYLERFLTDGDIAVTNSDCERKFAFFGVLRAQIKMFGSFEGARVAGNMESIAQTARNAVKDMRIYYQYLFERLIPYVKEHGLDTEYSKSEEMDRFMGWSDAYIQYEAETLERERQLIIPLAQNI